MHTVYTPTINDDLVLPQKPVTVTIYFPVTGSHWTKTVFNVSIRFMPSVSLNILLSFTPVLVCHVQFHTLVSCPIPSFPVLHRSVLCWLVLYCPIQFCS